MIDHVQPAIAAAPASPDGVLLASIALCVVNALGVGYILASLGPALRREHAAGAVRMVVLAAALLGGCLGLIVARLLR